MSKPVLVVDCDDVLCEYVWGGTPEQCLDKVNLFSETEAYRNLPVMENCQKALTTLANTYEIYVVTARFPHRAEITKAWCDRHFPNLITNIHHTFDKASKCRELQARIFIDDGPHNVEACAPVVSTAILFNFNNSYRWSTSVLPIHVATNWQEIVDFIESRDIDT